MPQVYTDSPNIFFLSFPPPADSKFIIYVDGALFANARKVVVKDNHALQTFLAENGRKYS